jgi:hypothetical protein
MTNAARIRHLAAPAREPVSSHPAANNAFIAGCMDFDTLIERLQAARALHFGADPAGQRNWSEAVTVAEMNRRLASALDFITGTEE